MPVPAGLRLIRAALSNARECAGRRAPGSFCVDGEFHLEFEPISEPTQSWS